MSTVKNIAKKLLLWSQKFTKTDMIYLTRGGFWLVLEHFTQILSSLVLVITFANLLPKETYGSYQFIMSISTIIGALTLTGMSTAITRSIATGNNTALLNGFRIQMKWNLIMFAASVSLALYYYVQENFVLSASFLIIGCFIPFIEGFRLYRSYLIGKSLFKENAVLGIWRKPLPIISLLLTLIFTQDLLILIFVYFFSTTISLALLFFLTIKKYNLKSANDTSLKGYSRHLSVMESITIIANHIDKVLVFHFLGASAVGSLVLAQLPVAHIRNLFGLSKSLTFPKMSRVEYSTLKTALPYKIVQFTLLIVAVIFVYILITPLVFSNLFPLYPEASYYSQLLALGLIAIPITLVTQALTAHKKMQSLYLLRLSTPILRMILLFACIPLYGIIGAIVAILATNVWSIVLSLLLLKVTK